MSLHADTVDRTQPRPKCTKRIAVICPGKRAGGTNLLLGRVSMALHKQYGHELTIVDLPNGYLRNWFLENNVPHQFIQCRIGSTCIIPDCDAAIIPSLPAFLIGKKFHIDLDTKLIMWSTAPQDIFKYIPIAYFFNRASWETKKLVAKTVFRSHGSRISSFIDEASRRHGLIFMDQHNVDVNSLIFGDQVAPIVVPICTEDTNGQRPAHNPSKRNAYWVGRVEDFKTESIRGFIRAILQRNMRPFDELVVVGDGEDLSRLRQEFADPRIRWLGFISPHKLDREIRENAMMVAGHGTSVLEAAKYTIPSLVIDGSYHPISPEALKGEWLFRCPAGYVGKIAHPSQMHGRPIWECLDELVRPTQEIGSHCFTHWKCNHSPTYVASQIEQVIEMNTYHVRDLLESKATKPGRIGQMMQVMKRILGRNY